MKETIAPVISVVVNGTSVTYSYSPSLQGWTDTLSILVSHRPALSTREESLFIRQGDYWTIGYQKHVAFLKATRGLRDLALLLRHPGREFHVCELVGQVIGRPLVLEKAGTPLVPGRADSCPMLVRSWTRRPRPNTSTAWTISEETWKRPNDLTTPLAPSEPGSEMDALAEAARLGRRTWRTESKAGFRSGTRTLRSDQANQVLNQENR